MGVEDPPSPEELAAELEQALPRDGLRASKLAGRPLLIDLAYVRARAASDVPLDRAVAFLSVLEEACNRLGPGPPGEAARILFTIAPLGKGVSLKVRRKRAADALNVGVEYFRKDGPEDRLVRDVAEQLYALETRYRRRQAGDATVPDRTETRLAIDWLERHNVYGRFWTIIYALRADLLALLRLRGEPDRPAYGQYLESSLWWYARFQRELAEFIHRFGGLWLLADADAEVRIADAIYRLEWHPPFSQQDDSWLRTTLGQVADEELDPFAETVRDSERGQAVLAQWREWIERCACAPDQPDPDCPVHQTIGACETYTEIVDSDWQQIADWYRRKAANPGGIDVTELFERFAD